MAKLLVPIRLEEEMVNALQLRAEAADRNLSQEIRFILGKTVKTGKPKRDGSAGLRPGSRQRPTKNAVPPPHRSTKRATKKHAEPASAHSEHGRKGPGIEPAPAKVVTVKRDDVGVKTNDDCPRCGRKLKTWGPLMKRCDHCMENFTPSQIAN